MTCESVFDDSLRKGFGIDQGGYASIRLSDGISQRGAHQLPLSRRQG